MEFSPKDSVLFRNAIDALVGFLPHAILRFSADGLSVRGMDVSHVGFVDYFLAATDCTTYKVPVATSVGIDTAIFARSLASVGASDRVVVTTNKSGDSLIVSYTNEKIGKKVNYTIRTLEIDEDALDLPELSYSGTVVLKTGDIAGVVKEVSTFGETIGFKLDEDGFHITCSGDAGHVSQTLLNTDDRVMELTEDSVAANYGIKYVNNILRGGGALSSTAKLEFDATQPLRASFEFGASRFVAYLAPKVMDD